MKHKLLYVIVLMAFIGCKKDPQKPNIPIEIPADLDYPFLFGQTRVTDNYYVTTRWFSNSRDTSLVSYAHKNLVINGIYSQGNITSPGGIAKNVNFFGTEVTDTENARICQFLDKSTPVAPLAGRNLNSNYIESYQGITTFNGNTYVIVLGGYKGQKFSSYYYKFDAYDGKPTFHPLPKTQYGNGYAWYAGTTKGLIVAKSQLLNDKTCFLEVNRDETYIDDFKLEMPGYKHVQVEWLVMENDSEMVAVVSAKKENTAITALFYVTINIDTRAVKIYQPDIPEGNFHFGESGYADGKVYVPAYENAKNKCSYFVLNIDNPTGKIKSKQVELPVKNVTYGSTSKLVTNGINTYVIGEQNGLACYWKNGKLVEINNRDATRSFITQIMTF